MKAIAKNILVVVLLVGMLAACGGCGVLLKFGFGAGETGGRILVQDNANEGWGNSKEGRIGKHKTITKGEIKGGRPARD
jgi:hypothetical protein